MAGYYEAHFPGPTGLSNGIADRRLIVASATSTVTAVQATKHSLQLMFQDQNQLSKTFVVAEAIT